MNWDEVNRVNSPARGSFGHMLADRPIVGNVTMEVPKSTLFHRITQDLQTRLVELQETNEKLRQFRDAVLGSRPCVDSNVKEPHFNQETIEGQIGFLLDRLGCAVHENRALASELSQIA